MCTSHVSQTRVKFTSFPARFLKPFLLPVVLLNKDSKNFVIHSPQQVMWQNFCQMLLSQRRLDSNACSNYFSIQGISRGKACLGGGREDQETQTECDLNSKFACGMDELHNTGANFIR